jgi:uncharacterized membrane protein
MERRSATALFAAIALAVAGPAMGQQAQQPAPAPPRASLAHSGLKTMTYEVGNTINNFIFLSAATGGLASGGLLTAFNTAQSLTVYTVNDFLWERAFPPPPPGEPFDAQASLWRTTLKYMTGKPVVASIKILAIYAYTGVATTAIAYGLAATTGASVVFFANNLAWDYYDQVWAPRMATCEGTTLGCAAGLALSPIASWY